MNTYNEKEIIVLLQDPARQRSLRMYCQRIQRTAILADTPDGTFS